jgi:hypothetical protein
MSVAAVDASIVDVDVQVLASSVASSEALRSSPDRGD